MFEKPITHFGWTGSGYIVTDNDTGAGAYKISGGSNGGFMEAIGAGLIAGLGILGFLISLAPFFLILAVLLGPLIALCIGVIGIWSLVLYEIVGKNMIDHGSARTYLVGLSLSAVALALGVLFASPFAALIFLLFLPVLGIFIAKEMMHREVRYA